MEHISDSWTSDDIEGAISSATSSNTPTTALTKLIEEIVGTPAGDWTECSICLDVPTAPIITTCRHVFCSECINSVFENLAARGAADGDDDDDNDVEELGQSIACPDCRHKLFRQNISIFTPPKPKGAPLPQNEAIELYEKLNWDPLADDSDDESLPDLQSIFSKLPVRKESTPIKKKSTLQSEIIDLDEEEDLLEVFRNNPVPRAEIKKERPSNMSEHWAGLLDRELVESTKLTKLKEQLAEWREKHPEDKVIIFSQFVRALDLVEKICEKEGWNCTRYQGDMSLDQREASLRTFEDDDDVSFMLTSLKCGGVGLNLTSKLLI